MSNKVVIDNIDRNLEGIRLQLSALAANINHVPTPTGTMNNIETNEEGPNGQSGEYADGVFYPDVEPTDSSSRGAGLDLASATYAIRQASTSIRGYAMLLDQMGLSKDQKKMIKEIENVTMVVTKLITAIKVAGLMIGAGTGTPMGLFYAFAVGGELAATAGYGSKISSSITSDVS